MHMRDDASCRLASVPGAGLSSQGISPPPGPIGRYRGDPCRAHRPIQDAGCRRYLVRQLVVQQVIPLAVAIGCDPDGDLKRQNILPQAYALGTSLSVDSADLSILN